MESKYQDPAIPEQAFGIFQKLIPNPEHSQAVKFGTTTVINSEKETSTLQHRWRQRIMLFNDCQICVSWLNILLERKI